MYADDMTIIVPRKSKAEVIKIENKEQKLVCSWLIEHKLIANLTKTKYMIFSTKPQNLKKHIKIQKYVSKF